MQALGSGSMLASSSVSSRKALPFNCSTQTRIQTQAVHRLPGLKIALGNNGYRQITLTRAVSGGADTLDQRKQEAREWINAWKSNGASAAQENGSSGAGEAVSQDDDDDDYDEDLDYDDDESYEEDDSEGQDPDFEEAPRSEGPFKYNIPNSDKGGKFSPDYTLADGAVIFTSKTLSG